MGDGYRNQPRWQASRGRSVARLLDTIPPSRFDDDMRGDNLPARVVDAAQRQIGRGILPRVGAPIRWSTLEPWYLLIPRGYHGRRPSTSNERFADLCATRPGAAGPDRLTLGGRSSWEWTSAGRVLSSHLSTERNRTNDILSDGVAKQSSPWGLGVRASDKPLPRRVWVGVKRHRFALLGRAPTRPGGQSRAPDGPRYTSPLGWG